MAKNIYELSQEDVMELRDHMFDNLFEEYTSAISVKMKEIDRQVSEKCVSIAGKYEIYVDEKMLIEMLTQDKDRYRQAYRDGYAKGFEKALSAILEQITEPEYE